MRNSLPKKPYSQECGIVNLDNDDGPGTHWVAYYKNKNYKEYFDSFGNLQPPIELVEYLQPPIYYNYEQKQKFNTVICGQLCLKFLIMFKIFN